MEKTVVIYKTQDDNGTFSVVKKTAKTDHYSSWMPSDEKTTVLASGMPKWNAEYAVAALEHLSRAKRIKEPGTDLDIDSLDCLKNKLVSADELAFCYVRDTIGSGWALHNAYKLTGKRMIDLWLKGSACRFGFLPLDIEKDVVFEKLASAVDKVIKAYTVTLR